MTKNAGHPGPIMRDPSASALEQMDSEQQLVADRYLPSEHEKNGGASLVFSAWMLVLAVVGIFASAALYREELRYQAGGGFIANCDLNAVVKCSSSLGSWQSQLLFGVPNALVGLILFAALATVAVALAARRRLPQWMWWGFTLAVSASMVLVVWFIHQSINFFGALCPYCMLTWVVALALFVTLWRRQIRVTPALYRVARPLVVMSWGIGAAIFVIGLAWVVIGLWNEIVKLF